MTKKKLNWRLTDLPTAGEVAELVDSEVITKEEARDILFNEKDNENAQIDELKKQIDFLQNVIDNLSKGNRTTITYTPTLPQYTYWTNKTPAVWMKKAGGLNHNVNMGNIAGTTQSYAVNTGLLIK